MIFYFFLIRQWIKVYNILSKMISKPVIYTHTLKTLNYTLAPSCGWDLFKVMGVYYEISSNMSPKLQKNRDMIQSSVSDQDFKMWIWIQIQLIMADLDPDPDLDLMDRAWNSECFTFFIFENLSSGSKVIRVQSLILLSKKQKNWPIPSF